METGRGMSFLMILILALCTAGVLSSFGGGSLQPLGQANAQSPPPDAGAGPGPLDNSTGLPGDNSSVVGPGDNSSGLGSDPSAGDLGIPPANSSSLGPGLMSGNMTAGQNSSTVPEFGTLPAAVLAVSVVSAIIFGSRRR